MNKSSKNAHVEALYREHKDHIYSFVLRLSNQGDLAADITQQTFVKLLTGDIDFDALQTPRAYLFRMARNTLIDEWKRKKETTLSDGEQDLITAIPDDSDHAPGTTVEQRNMQDKVEQAIQLMKPRFRELMLLRYTEDLSVKEIASITDRSLNDVKVNLHRARIIFDKDFTHLMYSRVAKSRDRCNEIGELLAPYGEKEMPQEQIDIVASHMTQCQICSGDMQAMKQDRRLFAAIPILIAPMSFDQLVPSAEAATVSAGSGTVTSTKGVATVKAVAIKIAAGVVVATSIVVTGYKLSDNTEPEFVPPVASVTSPAPQKNNDGGPGVPSTSATTRNNKEVIAEENTGQTNTRGVFVYTGAPYVAEVISMDTGSSERSTQKQYLSRYGSRQETSENGKRFVTISNFKKRILWMIDADSKTYVEDRLDEKGNPTGDLKYLSGANADTENGVSITGVGWNAPCEYYKLKKKLGVERMQGRQTEKWACGSSDGSTVITEWFDPQIKLVVRSASPYAMEELRDIRLSNLSADLFELPKGVQKVTLKEMLGAETMSLIEAMTGMER